MVSVKAQIDRLSAEGASVTAGKFGECRWGGTYQVSVGFWMDGCLHPFQPLAGLRIERIDEKGGDSCRQQSLFSRVSGHVDILHGHASNLRNVIGSFSHPERFRPRYGVDLPFVPGRRQ